MHPSRKFCVKNAQHERKIAQLSINFRSNADSFHFFFPILLTIFVIFILTAMFDFSKNNFVNTKKPLKREPIQELSIYINFIFS